MKLPAILTEYFAAANRHDSAAAAACFAVDAGVHDEKRDHVGPAAIRDWVEETSRKYQPRFDVIRTAASGDDFQVVVRVSGTFPGSPVELDHVFTVREGRIAALRID